MKFDLRVFGFCSAGTTSNVDLPFQHRVLFDIAGHEVERPGCQVLPNFCDCLGISVSWLNQIAVERVEEQERIKQPRAFAELEEIDKYCRERKDNYRDDINILNALLRRVLIQTLEGFDHEQGQNRVHLDVQGV